LRDKPVPRGFNRTGGLRITEPNLDSRCDQYDEKWLQLLMLAIPAWVVLASTAHVFNGLRIAAAALAVIAFGGQSKTIIERKNGSPR
jgi:hypothetical protein